ncbi:NAD(P)/FAD-dependent oxidoreductase [Lysinibacillus sp. 54212]|uniref:NAD(P)/FAD-dependent oxidoreductase n=1 Tax=Lysinibacillus sp. 54212 TaxID=3119829 RepID=UPI002FCA3C27
MKQKVIVVGGGIIGTSVAYYLTKKDIEVILFEAKDIAAGSSGSCDRAIMLQSKKPGPNLDLALKSAEMYKTLELELEEDLEYHKGGGMILIENEFEFNVIKEMVERQNQAGLNVSIISGDEARKKIPALSKKIIAATWWEEDAEISPMGTAFAFAKAAQKNNATIKLNCEVQSLVIKNGRIIGVKAADEIFYADSVVVCTGVWTKKILETINIDVPIIPRKGQILVTERLPQIIDCNILSGSYIASKLQKTNGDPYGIGLAIGQTQSGTLLIGGSREFAGFDSSTNSQVIREIAKRAVNTFPFLKNVNLIRTFSGFRPFTPDNLPILSEVPSVDGLFIAAGHEGDGIALAPITGKIMTEMVSRQNIDINLDAFKIDRFSKVNV